MDRVRLVRNAFKSGADSELATQLPTAVTDFLAAMDNPPLGYREDSFSIKLPYVQNVHLCMSRTIIDTSSSIDPSVLLDAFEIVRPLSPEASSHESAIYQMLLLSLTAARAACDLHWDMEDGGETDVETGLEEIGRAYFNMIHSVDTVTPHITT